MNHESAPRSAFGLGVLAGGMACALFVACAAFQAHVKAYDSDSSGFGRGMVNAYAPSGIGIQHQQHSHLNQATSMSLAGPDRTVSPITDAVSALGRDPSPASTYEADGYCSRRNAMMKAVAIGAGTMLAGTQATFAAEFKVKMGTDSGQLVYEPADLTICKGDTITWVNNKGGPHNVVFLEDKAPSGFDADENSMEDLLSDEGATFSKKFDIPGTYGYRCAPHSGAGMIAEFTVK
jgi:plastocyanin